MSNEKWNDNSIQFPRLLAEIMATQDKLDMEALAESMHLSIEQVGELFDRADKAWEAAKGSQASNAPAKMTGMMVSTDDGETWVASAGVRVMFHDANEGDEGMQDLLLNVTTEGVILDLQDQESGEAVKTASLLIEDLVEKTH